MRSNITAAGTNTIPANILPANPNGNNVSIQNVSAAANLYISRDQGRLQNSTGTGTIPQEGHVLGPNQIWVLPPCWRSALFALADGVNAFVDVEIDS